MQQIYSNAIPHEFYFLVILKESKAYNAKKYYLLLLHVVLLCLFTYILQFVKMLSYALYIFINTNENHGNAAQTNMTLRLPLSICRFSNLSIIRPFYCGGTK